ncbi:transcriptional regulator [Acetobacter senegalensis]|uniref:transcriptional regulator n=1 Tax=Acetobacter senegalensis TaxID=446692 RepID=UPI003412E495
MSRLARIVDEFGGRAEFACACGVSRAAVWKWIQRDRIPAERCIAIERATGISRTQLRPDLFSDHEGIAA